MKQQFRLPFPTNEWRYLFLASPDRKLAGKVMVEKESFSSDFDHKLAGGSRPHITLAYFDADGDLETSLTQLLRQACSRHQRFSAGLFGYDGFESADRSTIYIKVQERERFLQLANSLRVINGLLTSNGFRSARLVNNPHLTIARRVPCLTYLKALEEYRRRRFSDTFLVKDLVLLKKQSGDRQYQRVTTLCLSASNVSFN